MPKSSRTNTPVGGACADRDPTTEDTKVAMRPTVMVMGPKKAVGMSACTPAAQGHPVVNIPITLRTLLMLVMVQMVAMGDIRVMCHLPRLPQGFPLSRCPGLRHHSSRDQGVPL